MSDYEVVNVSSATEVTNPTENENFVAFNSSTSALEKIKYSKLAKNIVENYTGSDIAGSRQSIQSAVNELKQGVNTLSAKTDSIGNGAPTPASTAASMTDVTKIYLYTGSETGYVAGNWYYYNGSTWVSGGTYGGSNTVVIDDTLSVSGQAADSKAVGDTLHNMEERLFSIAVEGTCLIIS